MSAKKTRSVRRAAETKSSNAVSTQKSQLRARRASQNVFARAGESVTTAVSEIPSSAIYWGLGALALGAAAVGAYIYRDRLVELYDTAVESMDFESKGDDSEETPVQSARKSKSNLESSQIEQH